MSRPRASSDRARRLRVGRPGTHRARGAFGVVGLVLALVLLLSACELDPVYFGEGERVAVLGDSISAASADEIIDRLDDTNEVAAMGVSGLTFPSGQFLANRISYTQPVTMVLELGTNDVWEGTPLPTIEAQMDTMIATFTDPCMVMVTVNEHTSNAYSITGVLFDNGQAELLNDAIRARADVVVDWDAAVNTNPALYLQADTIHPTPEGQQLLADVIADGVATCEAQTA